MSFFDKNLKNENMEYSSKRNSLRLEQPKIWLLEEGSFLEIRKKKTEGRSRSDATVKIARLSGKLLEKTDYRIIDEID